MYPLDADRFTHHISIWIRPILSLDIMPPNSASRRIVVLIDFSINKDFHSRCQPLAKPYQFLSIFPRSSWETASTRSPPGPLTGSSPSFISPGNSGFPEGACQFRCLLVCLAFSRSFIWKLHNSQSVLIFWRMRAKPKHIMCEAKQKPYKMNKNICISACQRWTQSINSFSSCFRRSALISQSNNNNGGET